MPPCNDWMPPQWLLKQQKQYCTHADLNIQTLQLCCSLSEVCLCMCRLCAAKFLFSLQTYNKTDAQTRCFCTEGARAAGRAVVSLCSSCFPELLSHSFNCWHDAKPDASELSQFSQLHLTSTLGLSFRFCFSRGTCPLLLDSFSTIKRGGW